MSLFRYVIIIIACLCCFCWLFRICYLLLEDHDLESIEVGEVSSLSLDSLSLGEVGFVELLCQFELGDSLPVVFFEIIMVSKCKLNISSNNKLPTQKAQKSKL